MDNDDNRICVDNNDNYNNNNDDNNNHNNNDYNHNDNHSADRRAVELILFRKRRLVQ